MQSAHSFTFDARIFRRLTKALAIALPVLLMPLGMTAAQDNPAAALADQGGQQVAAVNTGPKLPTMTVTARKKAESVQDIPGAVTLF
ncbi:MAG: hypothetical protein O2910_08950 [Proteobacteria bacterium]|nr:hypothetical protein [Pseudomonadota bacterium]